VSIALTRRPTVAADRAFLGDLYASTRADELAPVPWSAEQKRAFLDQQFELQDRYYRAQYAGADFDLLLDRDIPVGRLYVARSAAEIRVIDISLAPAARGRGYGTHLLRELLAESDATGVAVVMHVERFNPARRLYERLGFRVQGEYGPYDLMMRAPARVARTSDVESDAHAG
jgi:ribosomal protein S18 acetylase RimI-like enzyme